MQLGVQLRTSSLSRHATHGTNRMRSKTQKITDWHKHVSLVENATFLKIGRREKTAWEAVAMASKCKARKMIREYTLFIHPIFQNGKQWGSRSLLMSNPKYQRPHFITIIVSGVTMNCFVAIRNDRWTTLQSAQCSKIVIRYRFLLLFFIRLLSMQIWFA